MTPDIKSGSSASRWRIHPLPFQGLFFKVITQVPCGCLLPEPDARFTLSLCPWSLAAAAAGERWSLTLSRILESSQLSLKLRMSCCFESSLMTDLLKRRLLLAWDLKKDGLFLSGLVDSPRAQIPEGSVAINAEGGGFGLVSAFLLCSRRQKNCLAQSLWSEQSTQTTAHCTTCYFLHEALTPVTSWVFKTDVSAPLGHLTHLTREGGAKDGERLME